MVKELGIPQFYKRMVMLKRYEVGGQKLHKRKPEFEIEVPFISKKEKQIEIF